jgi:hypothetical protein
MAENERVSVNAEEALRVAGWIKEGKMGEYGNTGSVRFRRESGILVVTLEKQAKRNCAWKMLRPCSTPPHLPRCARPSAKRENETNIRRLGGKFPITPEQLSVVL